MLTQRRFANIWPPGLRALRQKCFFDAKRCQHLLANAGLPVSGTFTMPCS